jgi:hypothetical protein
MFRRRFRCSAEVAAPCDSAPRRSKSEFQFSLASAEDSLGRIVIPSPQEPS